MVERCYFCNSKDIVHHNEHYIFCKDCTAIYTESSISETNCDHILKHAVIAERQPWFKSVRDKMPCVITVDGKTVCSVCDKKVIEGGW